jgi:pimeloyl-ACP methyl ester carboxylesterase
MTRVAVGGLHVNVQQEGQGPELVLIHGLAADLAFWYFRHLPQLKQRFHVTVYDLRGHGLSDMPPSGYSPQDQADDLAGLLDALGIAKAHVVGHSFGGLVALTFAVRYPERVDRLVIADGRIAALQRANATANWPHFEAWTAEPARRGLTVGEDLRQVLHSLAGIVQSSQPTQASAAPGSFSPFELWNGGKRSTRNWLRLLSTTAAAEELQRNDTLSLEAIRSVRQPTCAIYGDHSFCLPSGQALQRLLTDCRTVLVPGAGHFHPLTHPLQFLSLLQNFLLGNKGGGSAMPQ